MTPVASEGKGEPGYAPLEHSAPLPRIQIALHDTNETSRHIFLEIFKKYFGAGSIGDAESTLIGGPYTDY